ncbi:MAG TPA: hypothetical protein VG838_03260 [Opitutaceae bacterium]|nr:hypothetical protein [Opitutaceae bacterium]
MKSLVYLIQAALVFGVPPLFGWMLLRRTFREAGWLALLPGSVVVGLAALMAIVNELRFFCDMRISVWSAYKLLLVLSLVLALLRGRRAPAPRLPGCVNRPWKLGIVAAGTIAVGFYYGIPAFRGYLNDAWWFHYPAAVQIQHVERFPLPHVFAADDPIYYHFGPDILAACWAFLLDLPVQDAWGWYVAILAPCAFLLAFATMARLARNYWSALLAAILLSAGGNLRWLLFLTGKYAGAAGALQVFNSQTIQGLLQLAFTPSHLLGIPLTLAIFLMFRHVVARPSAAKGAVLGLAAGTLTLVAEWYFLPLVAGIGLLGVAWIARDRIRHGWRRWSRGGVLVLATIVALLWGTFNNTYLAGLLGHFWMRYPVLEETAMVRQITTEFVHRVDVPDAVLDNRRVRLPPWSVPNLLPLRFNVDHFGRVPSWEQAASSGGSFIPILGGRFLMEAAPVLLLGLPFGLWLAWRRRTPVLLLLAWLTAVSVLPPIFLDWGYRSTDFLRFFTASYCYAAFWFAWLAGDWLVGADLRRRFAGGALAACALVSPVGLGVIGLLPGTIDRVKQVADTAQSLSQAAPSAGAAADDAVRRRAFEQLAVTTGDFLFPFTQGRDRVIVVVPPDQVPEVKYFPEWMKMATLSRIVLPVGWHWQNSLYSGFYREAVTTMSPLAVDSLEAKWVITSNLFTEQLPPPVARELAESERFARVARFREGRYYMMIYRVRP